MPIKKLKPMTSGTRHMSILVNKDLDKVILTKEALATIEEVLA